MGEDRQTRRVVATMLHRFRSNLSFKREQIAVFALLFNTLSWYFIGRLMIPKIGYAFGDGSFENLSLQVAYPSSIIVAGIVGAMFLAKIRKKLFFYSWVLIGVFASLFLIVPLGSSLFAALSVTCVLGASLGIGTPLCLNYFKESVSFNKRGTVGGIVLFSTMLSAPLVLISMPTLDLLHSAVLCALWRVWSVPFLLLVPQNEAATKPESKVEKPPSLLSVFRNKTFILYFAAWLMFALVDGLGSEVVARPAQDYLFLIRIIEPSFTGLSALVAGFVSDWMGRKRVLIFGFASLGIAYAVVGLFSHVWISWLFYFAIDGTALGLLSVLFMVVLWGDLSETGSEKFYAIGETPFFLTQIISIALAPYVALIPESGSFSLAAFFLFLAVLPLLYAPETLPEKSMKDREIRQYVEKAKKTKEKYT
jgi:MFS family permease